MCPAAPVPHYTIPVSKVQLEPVAWSRALPVSSSAGRDSAGPTLGPALVTWRTWSLVPGPWSLVLADLVSSSAGHLGTLPDRTGLSSRAVAPGPGPGPGPGPWRLALVSSPSSAVSSLRLTPVFHCGISKEHNREVLSDYVRFIA